MKNKLILLFRIFTLSFLLNNLNFANTDFNTHFDIRLLGGFAYFNEEFSGLQDIDATLTHIGYNITAQTIFSIHPNFGIGFDFSYFNTTPSIRILGIPIDLFDMTRISYNYTVFFNIPFLRERFFFQVGTGAYSYEFFFENFSIEDDTFFGILTAFGIDINLFAELYFTFLLKVDLIFAKRFITPLSLSAGPSYRFHI